MCSVVCYNCFAPAAHHEHIYVLFKFQKKKKLYVFRKLFREYSARSSIIFLSNIIPCPINMHQITRSECDFVTWYTRVL